MGRGDGGGLQPPQNLGNLDFLGSKRNLGKVSFVVFSFEERDFLF